MDRLGSQMYYSFKDAIRELLFALNDNDYHPHLLPVVIVDFYSWDAHYFEDEYDAQKYLKENRTDWDDQPPEGEDEDLVVWKFCIDQDKQNYPLLYKDYKFWREINGEKFYRKRGFVIFEPELIVNAYI